MDRYIVYGSENMTRDQVAIIVTNATRKKTLFISLVCYANRIRIALKHFAPWC